MLHFFLFQWCCRLLIMYDNFKDHKKGSEEWSIRFCFLHDDKGKQSKCKLNQCSKIIKAAGGSTSAMHNHLKTCHNINLPKKNIGQILSCSMESNYSTSNLTKKSTTPCYFSIDWKFLICCSCPHDGEVWLIIPRVLQFNWS